MVRSHQVHGEIDHLLNKGHYLNKVAKIVNGDICSRHRIREIIEQIRDYGVEDKYIFTAEDVLEKKRPNKIIRCLEEVAKLVILFGILQIR